MAKTEKKLKFKKPATDPLMGDAAGDFLSSDTSDIELGAMKLDMGDALESDAKKDGRKKKLPPADEDLKSDFDDVSKSLSNVIKSENKRFMLEGDSEYWFSIYFSTTEQKEHFLRETGLIKYGDTYIDGRMIAKLFGVTLPEVVLHNPLKRKPDRKLVERALPLPKQSHSKTKS